MRNAAGIGWMAILSAGCGAGGSIHEVPSPFDLTIDNAPYGELAGSSRSDLFLVHPVPDVRPNPTHLGRELLHLDGRAWETLPWPDAISDVEADASQTFIGDGLDILPAGEGEIWMSAVRDGLPVLVRVDATGAVVDDRSADITLPEPTPFTSLHGGSRGVFVSFVSSGERAWYRLDGDRFVPIDFDGSYLTGIVVVGPDEAYFPGDSGGFTRYHAGEWTPVPAELGNVTWVQGREPGDVWLGIDDANLLHGDGTSWTTVAVLDYAFLDTETQETRDPYLFAPHGDGQLSVLSKFTRPGGNGMDWADVWFVDGQIGVDGHYANEQVARKMGACDPACDGIGFWANEPIVLDDGAIALLTGISDDPQTLLVWEP